MFWNYRVVNLKSENAGEDWYCIREVYYSDDNEPEGHCDIAVGSDSPEDLANVLQMMGKALTLPVLEESDFSQGEPLSEFMQYVTDNHINRS